MQALGPRASPPLGAAEELITRTHVLAVQKLVPLALVLGLSL